MKWIFQTECQMKYRLYVVWLYAIEAGEERKHVKAELDSLFLFLYL